MAVMNFGTKITPTARPPIRMGGRWGLRGLGLTCPPGQTPTNQYDGTVKCCGGPTPESDPCSYLNSPQYVATQQQAQQNAIAGDAGLFSSDLAKIAVYPQNIQNDAIRCEQNPGQTFVDEMGITVTCPAQGTQNLSGGYTSVYTIPELAAMIAPNATPKTETPVNMVDVTNAGQTPNALANSAPKTTAPVTPGAGTNALSNSAVQTGTSTTPTQNQIANANNVTGNMSNVPDVTVGGVDLTAWLSQNWILVAAGAAALFILPGLMGGRR